MPNRPRAMILAAGLSTRLGAVGLQKPKPMMPICGEPLVKWVVLWLRSQGIHEIVINLHHLGQQIIDTLGDGSKLGVDIQYSQESEILGTGGGIRAARRLLDDGRGTPIVVVNGKILLDLDLSEVLELHRLTKAQATMVLRRDEERVWGANIEVDREGRVINFLGTSRHTSTGEANRSPLMFCGVHVLSPELLNRIPSHTPSCIVRDTYHPAFVDGARVYGWVSSRYWWEHSTVERYISGVSRILDGKAELNYRLGPLRYVDASADIKKGVEINASVWIGKNVILEEGVRIGAGTQIGEGVWVKQGASLQNCVIWPHSTVTGCVQDCVVGIDSVAVSANSANRSG